MDGSILTISLKAVLTGGQLYMFRTRDFRAPAAISFPMRQARDWQSWLVSAKLWTNATSQQLLGWAPLLAVLVILITSFNLPISCEQVARNMF